MSESLHTIFSRMQGLFTSEDMMIFAIVLALICLLPIFFLMFRRRGSVRAVALVLFILYLFANLSFTILNREVLSDHYLILQPTGDFKSAFYLDLGLAGTIRILFRDGLRAAISSIHIRSSAMAREVFLNILLYVPMGYLIPFIFKSLRNHVFLITLIGFFCSCATETAQLIYHIGYFQVDDIVTNTLGCLIGAILGCLLSRAVP